MVYNCRIAIKAALSYSLIILYVETLFNGFRQRWLFLLFIIYCAELDNYSTTAYGRKVMTSARDEQQDDYIARVKVQYPNHFVHIIRVENKQKIPIKIQIEPTGDIAPPLEPGDMYEVVLITKDGWITDVHVYPDRVSVWAPECEGQVFHNGISVAY